MTYKFTGKERDSETGLDYFGARYYEGNTGRWLSPDPAALLAADLRNPQSWNHYSYVSNNPLKFVDPLGLFEKPAYYLDGVRVSGSAAEHVAIDPGHGDKNDRNKQVDPGAVSGTTYEKDLALLIADEVTKELNANNIIVVQTRDGDVTDAGRKLQWRIDKAGSADMLVSIHLNATVEKTTVASGMLVLYNTQGKQLAESIAAANTVMKSNGAVLNRSLYLLNRFKGPAVLIEVGFINNPGDVQRIQTHATKIGRDIARGIIDATKE